MNYQYESHRIYANDEAGKMIAEITFPERADQVFVINHTFVDPSLRGKGVAAQLVQLAVDEINRQGGKIEATCWYAAEWLEKFGE